MADNHNISWVAGLLEGEGCFCSRGKGHNPIIQLAMTNIDILIRAAKILGCHKVIQCKIETRGTNPKQMYRTVLYGVKAIGWMMTLYVLMGLRRKEQIRECLSEWKNKTTRNYKERTPYSRGAIIVWSQEVCHR